MANERLHYLFDKFRANDCLPEELQEFYLLCLLPENESTLELLAELTWGQIPSDKEMPKDSADFILQRIFHPSSEELAAEPAKIRKILWSRIAVAASILLTICFAGYFLLFDKGKKPVEMVQATQRDDILAPQTNRAMILLADGKKVYLDSVANGQLAMQGNIKLVKLASGRIVYQSGTVEVLAEMKYNTLNNPRGSKVIDMILSDGSHIWLNAGSSVTYPVAFVGDERKVSITGEAYFEIAPDASKRFLVEKGNMSVQVFGTHFNVSAYDDEEEIKVTLLEGSVSVKTGNIETTLKPGQQAQVKTGVKVVNKVDLDQVIAWVKGNFSFKNSSMKAILREVTRWYDVEVVYEGDVANRYFTANISRERSLASMLKIFELSNIHFKIEGKKLTVLP